MYMYCYILSFIRLLVKPQFIPFTILPTAQLDSHFDIGLNAETKKQRIRLTVFIETGRIWAGSLKFPSDFVGMVQSTTKSFLEYFLLFSFERFLVVTWPWRNARSCFLAKGPLPMVLAIVLC